MDRLTNTIRPYAWGSRTALPALLGTPPTGEPQAELWMGAHPGAPSVIDRGQGPQPLDAVIDADPEGELGAAAVGRFGPSLPFLLKILAAGEPLSLQVHPDLDQARTGFAEEESRGVPIDAAHRNYRDANHKPELICALDDFVGLCGFRRPADTVLLLESLAVPALTPLIDTLRTKPEGEALREVLTAVLTAAPASVAETVPATAAALGRAAVAAKDDPAAYSGLPAGLISSLSSYAGLARAFPDDPGVIAALLLNHVRLQPGEALYLGAGVPHAYLSGLGVEILANSDNVVRSGLTTKHVDVPELLRIVDFRSADPAILRPVPVPGSDGEELYPTPIDEFRLSRYTLGGPATGARRIPATVPQILLCTEGSVVLTDAGGGSLTLARGESAFVSAADADLLVSSAAGDGSAATLFRATVSL
ncbi:mannose-6-phosphate isomerase [Streptacidiphilus sp. MAP12-16]|uniref:mannose-6-phosphate isomerase, class I n=1 Tax=Streptacidiphilus sp. MAP12-16 TaxID=3156300 RepID=UPI003512EC05